MIGHERLAEHLIRDRIAHYRQEADAARARRGLLHRARAPELRSRLAAALMRLAVRLEPVQEAG